MKSVMALGLLGLASAFPWSKEFNNDDLERQSDLKPVFEAWKNRFSRSYESFGEEAARYAIWEENAKKIAEMNSAGYSFKLRLNQFADMTSQEFSDSHKCLIPPREHLSADSQKPSSEEELDFDKPLTQVEKAVKADAPSSVDWTKEGVVSPVKDQGQCGSCWAFSATGSMECNYAIAHGSSQLLSEQQLVDCSGRYGNYGCNGGWYYDAWKYAEASGGLCTESEYPYTARDGTCKDSSCGSKYDKPKTYSRVTADSDSSLANAIATGCVSVAIEADQFAFQYYSSGVLTGTCGTSIDHAVLAVGYGTTGGQEYWKVKNSWGTSWGDNGYVLICRNCGKNGSRGECGINMYPYEVSE